MGSVRGGVPGALVPAVRSEALPARMPAMAAPDESSASSPKNVHPATAQFTPIVTALCAGMCRRAQPMPAPMVPPVRPGSKTQGRRVVRVSGPQKGQQRGGCRQGQGWRTTNQTLAAQLRHHRLETVFGGHRRFLCVEKQRPSVERPCETPWRSALEGEGLERVIEVGHVTAIFAA